MRKTILITLAATSLLLTGCVQANQNLNVDKTPMNAMLMPTANIFGLLTDVIPPNILNIQPKRQRKKVFI